MCLEKYDGFWLFLTQWKISIIAISLQLEGGKHPKNVGLQTTLFPLILIWKDDWGRDGKGTNHYGAWYYAHTLQGLPGNDLLRKLFYPYFTT